MKKATVRFICLALVVLFLAGCGKAADGSQVVTETTSAEQDPVLMARRDAAEAYMREMATVLWRATEDVIWTKDTSVNTPELLEAYSGTPMVIRKGRLYQGIPYSSAGSSAYNFYQYFGEADEKGYPTVIGLNWLNLNGKPAGTARIGNNCSGSVQLAWDSIGADIARVATRNMTSSYGYLPVGEYRNDPEENGDTLQVCVDNGGDVMLEAYAQLQKADAVVKHNGATGHTMMIVEVHVEYTERGTIDSQNSYVTVLHQTSTYLKQEESYYNEELGEEVYLTFGVDDKYTFLDLLSDGYLPITCDALVDSDAQKEEWVNDSEQSYSIDNIYAGTFTSSRQIAYVIITVTDGEGQQVGRRVCFAPLQFKKEYETFELSWFESNDELMMLGELELDALTAGTYRCTHVLTDAHGREYVMRDFEFVI